MEQALVLVEVHEASLTLTVAFFEIGIFAESFVGTCVEILIATSETETVSGMAASGGAEEGPLACVHSNLLYHHAYPGP